MQAIPLRPEIGHGLALEDSCKDERNAPYAHQDESTPQQPLNSFAREDADEEGDEGQFDQCRL